VDGSTIDIKLDKKLRYHEHVLSVCLKTRQTLRVIFEVDLMFEGVSKKTKPTTVS
jgi:hypothetical protein